jgi:hypothetical protein
VRAQIIHSAAGPVEPPRVVGRGSRGIFGGHAYAHHHREIATISS